jgi:DNA-binding NtrC family response regulator
MSYRDYMRRSSAAYVAQLLAKHGGRVPAAATEAGIHRAHLYKLMQQAGIEPPKLGRGHRGNDAWQALQS